MINLSKFFTEFLIPEFIPSVDTILSRFLGKVALEVLAFRLIEYSVGLDEMIDKPELDIIRNYTRFGDNNIKWPIHIRRIYPEDKMFTDKNYGEYDVLNEFSLLYTESRELYFILAIKNNLISSLFVSKSLKYNIAQFSLVYRYVDNFGL